MPDVVKTSVSDPLIIQSVGIRETKGTIGMTLCPGRKGTSMAGGSWDRDLALDLEAIRHWAPDLAITLLEKHEYELLGIPQFPEVVAKSGLPWAFLPIPDGGVPGEFALLRWQSLGPRTRNILRRGGRVLVHCRAGLGRTGLIAATLLVEFGEDAESAIRRVRKARPQTIETQAQEDFVLDRPSPPRRPGRATRLGGLMYGAAIGDALGAAFEFVDHKAIEAELGEPFVWTYREAMRGSLLYPRAPGLPTDDTAMALSVADVIASKSSYSAASFAATFLNDLDRDTGRFRTMFWDGGPGGATTRALRKLEAGAEPATCGGADDGGNGAAMRAHPIGVLADRDRVLEVAAVQAKVTHGHPAAVAAAQAVAVLVYDAMQGMEPELGVPLGITDATFVDAWTRAHKNLRRRAKRLPAHLLSADMSGWETVATAHAISYVFQDDPMRAVAAAAASGGDTDTVAAIVGALIGARYGMFVFPKTLLDELGSTKRVLDAVASLHAMA